MSIIIKLGAVILLTSFLATLALEDSGQVSLVWGEWIIETSVSFLIVILAVTFIVLYILTRIWSNILHFPKHWQERREIKRHNKAEASLSKGMIALEHGDWKIAEKHLIKSAKFSDAGLMHYLSAAKMAHNQNSPSRRDQYLTQAKELYIDDFETIGLVEARLLKTEKPQKALSILNALHQKDNRNRAILSEYANLLHELKIWHVLDELLPKIKKVSALEKQTILDIETQVICNKISCAENTAQLNTIWQALAKLQQLQPTILAEYVEQKIGWNEEKELPHLIIKSINKNWDDRLVYQFGRLHFSDPTNYLKKAEKWLPKRTENPILQLTLGRIACQAKLWGIAQTHLQASLKIRAEVETYHALAKCYEEEGLDTEAALIYKQAILTLDKNSK